MSAGLGETQLARRLITSPQMEVALMFLSKKSSLLLGAGMMAALMIQCAGDSNRAPAEAPMPPAEEPQPVAAMPKDETEAASTASGARIDTPAPPSADQAPTTDRKPQTQDVAALDDGQIAAITASANGAEIEQAKLARTKSKNPRVLKFANMMITHHGDAQRKQEKLKITPVESSTSAELVAETNKTLESLKQLKGKEFDQAYIQAQIDGHKLVLTTIEGKLLPNAKSGELKAYLEEIRPTVAQHLEAAQAARDELAGQQPAPNPALNSAKSSAASPATAATRK